MTPRAVCTIDLDALEHNFGQVQRLVGPHVRVCGVIKSNAYGHGATKVGQTLLRAGAHALAITSLDEARELRESGIQSPLLVLSGVAPEEVAEAIRLGIVPVVWDEAQLRGLARAIPTGATLPVHLKFDTGMRRLGADDAAGLVAAARELPVRVEGVFSHLACADEPGHASVREQRQAFESAIAAVKAGGLAPGIRHLANSAGVLADPETHLDMVRIGLLLYGCLPGSLDVSAGPPDLKPVMELRTHILHLKTAPAGSGVGYGWTFRTPRETRLAVLPVGYAQGYPRALSNQAEVAVRGQRAPVVGAISMDHTTIDVTDIDGAACGDEVTLWGGTDGPEVMDLAERAGTIGYELLTRIPRDAPRTYKGRNE